MTQKRWALLRATRRFYSGRACRHCAEAERLGYTDAWSLEIDGVDGFAPGRRRPGHPPTPWYGHCTSSRVVQPPWRCLAGLGEIAPGRFVWGLGRARNQSSRRGTVAPFAPASRVRDMVPSATRSGWRTRRLSRRHFCRGRV
jgi:hypothetical protein